MLPRENFFMFELSCDLGEASTPDERQTEAAIWPLVDAANVACGGHAGEEVSMVAAIAFASKYGVVLGAHPSYPDRENFGRATVAISHDSLRRSIVEQLRTLGDLAAAHDLRVERVKPHGALYNDAHHDAALAACFAVAVREFDESVALVAAASSQLVVQARATGLSVITESFADRRYRADGSLVPRNRPDSLLLDVEEAAAQAVSLVSKRGVVADDGSWVGVEFDTICVHADMKGAVERLIRIREALVRQE